MDSNRDYSRDLSDASEKRNNSKSQHNHSDRVNKNSIFNPQNLSLSSIGQSFRKSIRRISDYYSANNNIIALNIARHKKTSDSSCEAETDSCKDNSNHPDKNELKIKIIEKENIDKSLNEIEDYESPEREKKEEEKLNFWATLFTFIKLNIVSGFLFLPAGFLNGGWVFSMVAMFFIMILNIYSMIAICESSEKVNTFSLSKIGLKAMKKFGFYVCEIGIAFTQICFPCSYVNLSTTIFNDLINIWGNTDSKMYYYLYIGIALGIVLIPLCLIRNISKFSVFHLLGDISLLATLICLIYESVKSISNNTDFDINKLKMFNSSWAKLLGMGIASTEGIGLILPIKEKSAVSKNTFNWVIILGTGIVAMILIGFPFVMYICYQDKVQEIILTNLDLKNNLYIQIILIFLIFSILIVYPVVLYPSFTIINEFFLKNIQSETKKYWLDTLIRIFIVIGTIIVGILSIGRFDTLLALVGSGVCCPIALIFPTLFHFQLFKNEQGGLKNFSDLFVCISGIIISITVLIFTFVG